MELCLHYSYNHIKMCSFGKRTPNMKRWKWPFLAMANHRQDFSSISLVINIFCYLCDMEKSMKCLVPSSCMLASTQWEVEPAIPFPRTWKHAGKPTSLPHRGPTEGTDFNPPTGLSFFLSHWAALRAWVSC